MILACGRPYIPFFISQYTYPSRITVPEFVVFNYILWHIRHPESHVFVSCHASVEVEILDVHGEKIGSRCAYDAVYLYR